MVMDILNNGIIFSNLDLLSVSIIVAATVVLGFSVYLNDSKSFTNKSFLLFTIVVASWGFVNYLSYQSINSSLAFWFIRIELFLATWLMLFLFQLFYVFPYSEPYLPSWYKFFLIPATVLISIINLTPLVFLRIKELSPEGRIISLETGPGILIFGLLVISLLLLSWAILIKKTINSSKEDKTKLIIGLSGAVITFTLVIYFIFILPAFFKNTFFIPYAALFTFPLVASTSYAILRYKLFNVRVAWAGILVFLLSVITSLEVIFARDLALIIYRSSIFLLILVFGILLIRGVIREVEQKEKLVDLNKKLELAYEEVDRLSKAKSEFISIASHQLRTPLSAIKGYISMLIEGTYGRIVEKAKTPMENVYKSNERLIKLVNDLLSISRIESGKMEFEPEESQIEEIIEGVVFDLKVNAEKKGLYLKWEKPETALPKLSLDRDKLRQVILNLVDNAIKYTQKGGVTISAQRVNDKLQIVIKDTGEGMTKEDLVKIFESFSRGTVGVSAYTEGAGLGLYIARKFVEMHGGKIWAESEGRSKGSTFFIELPIK